MTTILQRYGTVLRCYDNGGKTADRYTIIPPRWARDYQGNYKSDPRLFDAHPFHAQGFGMCVSAAPGPHLGKRIKWADLPADVQRFARQSFPEYCPEVTK